jgi:hypothetical protein
MHDVLLLAFKGLAGGCLVVAFALLSQGLEPKRFAGLFGAAPAVALASLTLTLLDEGAHAAHQSSIGMIAGGVGMIAYAAVVVPLLRRFRASRAALIGLGAWVSVAVVVAVPLLLLT